MGQTGSIREPPSETMFANMREVGQIARPYVLNPITGSFELYLNRAQPQRTVPTAAVA